MPPTTFYIENAKSNRSNCKKCKNNIDKGELRIVSTAYSETRDMTFTSNFHASGGCFQVPPRAMAGMSSADFVEEHLEDRTINEVLDDPIMKQQVIDGIRVKEVKAKKEKKAKKRANAKEEEGEEEEYTPNDNKKVKAERMEQQFKSEEEEEEESETTAVAPVVQQWVGCESCEKWRKLPANVSPEDLPDKWYCNMNTWDVHLANCDADEEGGADEEELEC